MDGRFACVTIGVQVKQLLSIHPGHEHPKRPMIHMHKIPSVDEKALLGSDLLLAAEEDWVNYSTWIEHGLGCITTTFCSPTT